MKSIKIPKYFNYNTFDEVLSQQRILIEEEDVQPLEEVIFDLSENEYISVLGLLFMAQFSDFLQEQKGCKCFVRAEKKSTQSWFARVMGLTKSDKPSKEVESYLNEIRVAIERCYNDKQSLNAVNKLIPIIKRELDLSEPLLKALNWALWELVGNAGLHGYKMYGKTNQDYSKPVYFCAFDYKKFIDMAILDTGRGIHKSFLESGREKYKNITNEEALSLAIQESESGDPQGSMGFGLFGCAEIVRKTEGKLVMISGNNKLILTRQEKKVLSSGKFDGTMVLLSIPQNASINLVDIFGKESVIVVESLDDLIGKVDE